MIFDTIEAYQAKLVEVNQHFGYPNGQGTDTYCDDIPTTTIEGKYPFPISNSVSHLFADCVIVAVVTYSQQPIEED